MTNNVPAIARLLSEAQKEALDTIAAMDERRQAAAAVMESYRHAELMGMQDLLRSAIAVRAYLLEDEG